MTYQQQVKLENSLRDYIALQKVRLEQAMNNDSAYVYITYDHNKGDGKWRVVSHYKPEFDVTGAVLATIVDEALDRISRSDRLDKLPRLLTSVVTGNTDSATIIEDESDE